MKDLFTGPKLIGLILFSLGIILFIVKLLYDIAARISLAKKEYKAIMASGLIAAPEAEEDAPALKPLSERPAEAPSDRPPVYRTEPLKEGAAPLPLKRTADLDTTYLTAPLKGDEK